MSQNTNQSSSWTTLHEDYELRNTAKFSELDRAGSSQGGKGIGERENGLPELPAPSKLRKNLLVIGLIVASLDLCILPITYFYSLTYGTKFKRRTGMRMT